MATTQRTVVLTPTARVALAPVALTAALALAFTLVAGSCRRRPPVSGTGHTLTDEADRRVTPRATPSRRVVSLAPSITELLFAIGAGQQVVGIDNYSDEPVGKIEHLPKVGSNYEPSLEKIAALDPDVVFTSVSANRRETAEALERLGVPVFVTDTRSIGDMDRVLRNLGVVTGRVEAAQAEASRLRANLEGVRRRVPTGVRPKVLVVVWDEPLYVAGRNTFTHDLVEVAGGINIAADAIGFAKYPLESVLRSLPEVILLPTHSDPEQRVRAVAYWSRWAQLPAVKAKRVHAVQDALIIRPGARLAKGAETLFNIIHADSPAR